MLNVERLNEKLNICSELFMALKITAKELGK